MASITLSRSNYFYNLDQVAKRVKNIDQIAVVLKDNGYGHGLTHIGELAKEYGISRAVVRTYSEALQIKELFDNTLILAPEKIVFNNSLSYTINSIHDIEKFPKKCRVELKVDTGMHRLGINIDEVKIALKLIRDRELNLIGVFTHYREADELSSVYFWQREEFQKIKEIVKSEKFENIVFHSNNSAGTFRQKDIIQDEIVRVGIASYGYLPDNKALQFPELKPVLSLYADRVGFQKAKKGYRVGYGGILEIEDEEYIGIYDIGYGDGFRRIPVEAIQNKQFKTADGSYLLGKVSMDSIALNSRRNRVLLFNSVKVLSNIFNTIDYEILVTLSPDIKRVIVE